MPAESESFQQKKIKINKVNLEEKSEGLNGEPSLNRTNSDQQPIESKCQLGASDFEELEVNGLCELHKVIKVPDDACSLFNSLSYLVYGDTSQGSLMRCFIVEHVSNNWTNFKKYAISPEGATKYSTKEEYISEMSKSTTYGSGCELIAAGTIFPYCFEVYVEGTRSSIFGDSKKPIRRLRLSTEVNNHYDAYEPNDEVRITVNNPCGSPSKRKLSPGKNKCIKVWRKKLKIEENPFATVWLVDNNSSDVVSEFINNNNSQNVEEVKTAIQNPIKNSFSEKIKSDAASLLVINTDQSVSDNKPERGRPKKVRPLDLNYSGDNLHEKNETVQAEKENKIVNEEQKVESDIMVSETINLKKRLVGRPRMKKPPLIHSLDKRLSGRPRKTVSLSSSESVKEKVKKKRGRPKKRKNLNKGCDSARLELSSVVREKADEDLSLLIGSEVQSTSQGISLPSVEFSGEVTEIKKKRGRPKKKKNSEEVFETTSLKQKSSSSNYSSFTKFLASKLNIPLPGSELTKTSYEPPQLQERLGESISNVNIDGSLLVEKTKRPRGRPRKKLDESRIPTVEKIKRPRGRPKKRRLSLKKVLENSASESVSNNAISYAENIENNSSVRSDKQFLLNQTSLVPETLEIQKRPRGRPRKVSLSPNSVNAIKEFDFKNNIVRNRVLRNGVVNARERLREHLIKSLQPKVSQTFSKKEKGQSSLPKKDAAIVVAEILKIPQERFEKKDISSVEEPLTTKKVIIAKKSSKNPQVLISRLKFDTCIKNEAINQNNLSEDEDETEDHERIEDNSTSSDSDSDVEIYEDDGRSEDNNANDSNLENMNDNSSSEEAGFKSFLSIVSKRLPKLFTLSK